MHGVFVDFITIKQRHPGRYNPETGDLEPALPMVDGGVVGKWGRDEEGNLVDEPEWSMQSHLQIEGSFSTTVRVKCDGFTVELSGNVGRLHRPDNVFNFGFEATLQKCNELLAQFGLPPFSAGEHRINLNPSSYDIKHGLFYEWSGASISRLDLTCNFLTGSPVNAKAVIDWLATQSMNNVKRGRGGETSTAWGSKGGRKLLKAYIKAAEMLAHRNGRTTEEILADPVYQYALLQGLVRLELEAHRLMLRDNGLRFLGDITMEKLVSLFKSEVDPLLNRTKADLTSFSTEHLPSAVRTTAEAFLRGANVRGLMSTATFYRHAKVLRDYGIDISEPLPTLHKFASVIKVIEINPITEVPDWYWNHQRKLSMRALSSASSEKAAA